MRLLITLPWVGVALKVEQAGRINDVSLLLGPHLVPFGQRRTGGTRETTEKTDMSIDAIDTCPLEKFQASLDWILEQKLWQESNITSKAPEYYADIATKLRCSLDPKWSLSQKPLIVNVGEGTTATRWLWRVMGKLGFAAQHYAREVLELNPPKGLLGSWKQDVNGSFKVDNWDFISDQPISTITWELVQSHPKGLFLMTMRDPTDWFANRLKHSTPVEHMGVPCGQNLQDNMLVADDAHAALMYTVYSTWAVCVLPPDRFLAVNVFANDTASSEFLPKLINLLEANGLQTEQWAERVEAVMLDM